MKKLFLAVALLLGIGSLAGCGETYVSHSHSHVVHHVYHTPVVHHVVIHHPVVHHVVVHHIVVHHTTVIHHSTSTVRRSVPTRSVTRSVSLRKK
jgi:hypothetical protein